MMPTNLNIQAAHDALAHGRNLPSTSGHSRETSIAEADVYAKLAIAESLHGLLELIKAEAAKDRDD